VPGRQIFDQLDRNKNGFLGKAELKAVVQDMEEEGFLLREGEEVSLEALLAALDANGDGRISWPEFEKALSGEAVDSKGRPVPALRWRCLSGDEARARSDELYMLAAKLQMKLGHLDDSDEKTKPKREELKAEILRLSQVANRFSVLADTKQQAGDGGGGGGGAKTTIKLGARRGDDIRIFKWDVKEPGALLVAKPWWRW
jgi:hypothetical protein